MVLQADTLPGLPDALVAMPPKASTYQARTLDEAIARSHALVDEVCERWPAERILMLFSGGNDSTLLGHLMRYRADTLPLNEVTVHLHMSGDCLCGCYAREGEIAGVELFAPDVAAQIHEIEEEARTTADIPPQRCVWGWGATAAGSPHLAGRLCSKCAPPIPGQLAMPLTGGRAA
jgi:hypothetical protein